MIRVLEMSFLQHQAVKGRFLVELRIQRDGKYADAPVLSVYFDANTISYVKANHFFLLMHKALNP